MVYNFKKFTSIRRGPSSTIKFSVNKLFSVRDLHSNFIGGESALESGFGVILALNGKNFDKSIVSSIETVISFLTIIWKCSSDYLYSSIACEDSPWHMLSLLQAQTILKGTVK